MKLKNLRRICKQAITWTAIFLVSFMGSPVFANPFGGAVQSGSASISHAGNTVTINQQSGRAVINWNGFSIGAGEVTRFNQPGANAAILNRVTGGDPSAILGQLQANGNVFLINPNGVLIGNGAQINVGGLTASTLDVSNSQFMNGGALDFRGNSQAGVVNYGTINANGGNIFLIGSSVENHGTLNAPGGTVGLAAGQHVRLADSANPNLVVKAGSSSISHSVANSGNINALRAELAANGGNVYGLAINNTGTIRATGSTTVGGEVYLTAPGGTIQNSGDIIASQGANGGTVVLDTRSQQGQPRTGDTQVSGNINTSGDNGGTVHILGDQIALSSATINASGLNGGGEVLIGGGYQGASVAGSDPSLNQNAINTTVDANSTINAGALNTGNGGRVIVWSDDATEFFGHANVRGGTLAGNGGFVEVSGRESLIYDGAVNLLGPNGDNGTLLLDPRNVEVQFLAAAPNPGFSRVTPLAIVAALLTGNVVVHTSFTPDPGQAGNLEINAPLLYTSPNNLSFFAHGDIDVNQSVLNNNVGDLNFVAGWDGMTGFTPTNALPQGLGLTTVDINAVFGDPNSFGNNNGSLTIGGGTQTTPVLAGTRFGATNVAAFDLNVIGGNAGVGPLAQLGFRTPAVSPYTVDGPINIALTGDLTATGGSVDDSYAQIGHGGLDFLPTFFEPDGNFNGDITVLQANNISLAGGAGENAYAQLGHGGAEATGNHTGDISVIASGELTIFGGGDVVSYAQLGHGGFNADGDHVGNINLEITGPSTITAGIGAETYAQIGHGGNAVDGNLEGIIDFSTGNLALTSGTGDGAQGLIGHGGVFGSGGVNGSDITIASLGRITLDTPAMSTAGVQIGHGGIGFDATGFSIDSNINVSAIQDLTMTALGENTAAQIGHGGPGSLASSGDITVSMATVELLALGAGSTTQIGHGGAGSAGDHTGDITVDATGTMMGTGFVRLRATGGASMTTPISTAQIGHGGAGATGSALGNISVTANGPDGMMFPAISLSTAGDDNFAHIGHGGAFYNDLVQTPGDLTGIISLSAPAGGLIAEGGNTFSSAQVGHGGPLSSFGDASGLIDVSVLNDIFFIAGEEDSYAQLGHGGDTATGDISGNINIMPAANITFIAGTGADAYAQLGHGGHTFLGDIMGDISVAANDVTFLAGSDNQAYSQLGHGGVDSNGMRNGTINAMLSGDVIFLGGSAESAFAQLGHGGFSSEADILGAIDVNAAGNIVFTGGSATSTYAQLGNGGDDSSGDRNGAINIQSGGNIIFAGGPGDIAFAQLGHNGFEGDQSDDIRIVDAQDISFFGGGGLFSFAQLGHRGFGLAPATDQTGVISIENSEDITFVGGTGDIAYSQLGHSAFSGDQLGLIFVNSDSIFFSGGSNTNAYSQLGHGGDNAVSTQRIGEIVINTGNLIFAGGGAEDAFAQLGHGGGDSIGDNSGDIGITALDILFTGGTAENAYAQLGHGGNETGSNNVGDFNINADDITFFGGTENDTYAQLGHGGDNADGDHAGDFDITASGIIFFNAGSGEDAYAQLGNGGNQFDGQASGQIAVSANTITFIANQLANAGGTDNTYAQLGHGGQDANGVLFGDISIFATNDITFTAGDDPDAFAQLGHGGTDADGTQAGDILIQNANDILFTAGSGFQSYAKLGHGGPRATADQTGGITIAMANDIRFEGGSDFGATAQLGHGGRGLSGDQMGNILISQANNITFNGGTGVDSYAQLGHGGRAFLTDAGGVTTANQMGDITITRANDIMLSGGSNMGTYAQLGHGGLNNVGDQTGDIFVRLVGSDLFLNAGISNNAYAQLGHGDASGMGTGMRTGDIDVIIDGTASLTGESMTSFAWIGHRSATMGGVSGNLVLAVDQLDPLNDGGGRLLMNNEFTALDMAGVPNEVRLFDTRRDGPSPQFIAQNALVNGVFFDIANQQPEFFSDPQEQWGSSTTFTLASPGPYSGPSTFFYVGRDLVLTADDLARIYGDPNPAFTFSTTGLQGGDTLATALNGTPILGSTANAFTGVGTAAITFLNGGALSANGYNLVLINGELTINPAPLVVTANNQNKVYGDLFTFNGTEFTTAGLKNGETVGSVDLASPGAAVTAGVAGGPYAITAATAQGGTFDPNNYTISYVNGQLNVTPAPLTLTANDQTKPQGTLFFFNGTEFVAVGLQNGDTVGRVDLSSLGAPPSAAPGLYSIDISNPTGAFDPANYDITFVPGTLNVLPVVQQPGNQITITPISGGRFLISGFGPTPFMTAPEEIYWRWTAHEFFARTLYNAPQGDDRPSQIFVIRENRPEGELSGQASP